MIININGKYPIENGVKAGFKWNNPEFMDMLNKLFKIAENEEIVEIEIDEWGLMVRIGHIPQHYEP
jgi:hypothetical protein